MGLISREASAPIVNGETADGNEVELEFAKLFNVINGNIEDANIKSAAAIDGSKIASSTLPGSRLESLAVTTGKIAANAVTLAKMDVDNVVKCYVETDTGVEAFATGTAFADLTGMTGVTVGTGGASDYVTCDLMVTCEADASTGGLTHAFTFEVDGTDKDPLAVVSLAKNQLYGLHSTVLNVHWAQVVPGTAAFTVVPRYRQDGSVGSGGGSHFGNSSAAGTPFTKVLVAKRIPHN